MKKIFAALLALATSVAFGATFSPISLLNPTGSSSGQAIVSSGTSSSPSWQSVVNSVVAGSGVTISGATGNVTVGIANNGVGLGQIAQQAANTVLANATGSTGNVAAFSMPSCSGTSNALTWTTSTGFFCNGAINATTLGGSAASAYALLAGSTFTGNLALSYPTATTQREIIWENGVSGRWIFQNDGVAETGSNAGSNLVISRFSDSGVFIDTPFTIVRSSGNVNVADGLTGSNSTTYFPTVPNLATLQALTTATYSSVTRLGYSTPGDTAPLVYKASGSACSLNAGNGDNGSQVKSANGLCWIAQFGARQIDASEFGLDTTGATDSTTQLQAAWNYAASVQQDLQLPGTPGAGFIKFSQITLPAPTGNWNGASSLMGNGSVGTNLKSTVTGTQCAITLTGTYGTAGFGGTNFGGFNLTANTANAGYGVCLNGITFLNTQPMSIQNFNIGISSLDSIRITLNKPNIQGGTIGIFANQATNSYPNDWNINFSNFAGQTQYAIVTYSPTDFNLRGGDFEGINTANNTAYCTILVSGNPMNGTKGLSLFGGYYQGNGGIADVCIVQNASGAGSGVGVHSINNVDFGRTSSTTYTTNSVYLANNNSGAQTLISMHGNSFNDFNSYSPSSSRPFWRVLNPVYTDYKITDWGDNRFGNATEAPGSCFANNVSACVNLPDGHIEEWGTATTSSATPGTVSVTWPLACPTSVDSVQVTSANGSSVLATGYGATSTTSGTLYSASGPATVAWRLLCH